MIQRVKKHLFTLHEKIGLLAAYGLLMFALGMGLNEIFSSPDDAEAPQAAIARIGSEQDQLAIARGLSDGKEVEHNENDALAKGENEPMTLALAEELAVPGYSEYIVDMVVKRGDTFTKLLTRSGVSRDEAQAAAQAMSKHYNLRALKVGQELQAVFQDEVSADGADGTATFMRLTLIDGDDIIELHRDEDGTFKASKEKRVLTKKPVLAKGTIDSSLYVLARSLDVPPYILQEAISAFSFDIDFQRDITSGTEFEILYDVYVDQHGVRVKEGNLLYASLTLLDDPMEIYRFSETGKDADAEYYTPTGRQMRKSLLKTPVNGAVLSSPFGMRKHPILGYNLMHKGVDFAAPVGTPIYAGGSGKVIKMGWNGGYGKYMRIRHDREYDTAYAHIHKFATGMRVGRKVRQGQIIGYVGNTGRSTGPHLHYEILKNGKHVNPMKIKLPPGKVLKGKELQKLNTRTARINELKSALADTIRLAQSE